jgi:hypothetical protein
LPRLKDPDFALRAAQRPLHGPHDVAALAGGTHYRLDNHS